MAAGRGLALPAGRGGASLAYPALLALGALDAAAYSVIAPVAPEIAARTGVGPAAIGGLIAAFPAGIALGFLVAGRAVGGRQQLVLLASLALLGAGALAFALGGDLATFAVARFTMGVGSGGLWLGVVFATLARWPDDGYRCMSRIFAAYSVGGLLGPLLGGVGGIAGPFLLYAALTVGGALLVVAMGQAPSREFAADRSTLRLPAFWTASGGILFATLALGVIEGVLPLRLSSDLGQVQIGLVLAATALVVAGAATVAARATPRRALVLALPFTVLGIGAAAAGTALAPWLAGLALAGVGVGLANTGSIGVLLDGVPRERSVTAIVAWSQVGIGGYLLGPLVGGWAAESFGYPILGAVLFVAALPVALLALREAAGNR